MTNGLLSPANWVLTVRPFVIGLCLAISYYFHNLQSLIGTVGSAVVVFGYLVLLFMAISHFVFRALSLDRPQSAPTEARNQLAWAGLAVVVGFAATMVIPIERVSLLREQSLQIRSLGERNPESRGDEVWILGVQQENGGELLPDDVYGPEWSELNGAHYTAQDGPAEVSWTGRLDQDIVVKLLRHPWSGLAEVTWNGETQVVDLYSDPGANEVIFLQPREDVLYQSIRMLVWATDSIWSGSLILLIAVAILRAMKQRVAQPTQPLGRAQLVLLFGFSVSTWLIYLLSNWPGISTVDTGMQWMQIRGAPLTDWHPAIHTLLMYALTRIWDSPAAVAIFQIVALSGIATWITKSFVDMGTPRWIAIGCFAGFVLSPTNGIMVNTLWKDILYGASVLLLSAQLVRVVISRGAWLKAKRHWVALALVMAVVALFRHNGPVIVAATAIASAMLYRQYVWRIVAATCIGMAIWLGTRTILYPLVGVVNSASQPGLQFYLAHHIAAQMAHGTPIEPSEAQTLALFRPDIPWPYDCTSVNPTVFDGQFNMQQAATYWEDLLRVGVNLGLRAPLTAINHQLCISQFVWRIRKPPPPNDFYFAVSSDDRGQMSRVNLDNERIDVFTAEPTIARLGAVSSLVHSALAYSLYSDAIALFWRPALQLYVIIGASLLLAFRTKSVKWFLVAVPVLANSAIIAAVAPGQDFRFQYSVFLVGALLGPMLVFLDAKAKNEPT
jgi:hypothetical protein